MQGGDAADAQRNTNQVQRVAALGFDTVECLHGLGFALTQDGRCRDLEPGREHACREVPQRFHYAVGRCQRCYATAGVERLVLQMGSGMEP